MNNTVSLLNAVLVPPMLQILKNMFLDPNKIIPNEKSKERISSREKYLINFQILQHTALHRNQRAINYAIERQLPRTVVNFSVTKALFQCLLHTKAFKREF